MYVQYTHTAARIWIQIVQQTRTVLCVYVQIQRTLESVEEDPLAKIVIQTETIWLLPRVAYCWCFCMQLITSDGPPGDIPWLIKLGALARS